MFQVPDAYKGAVCEIKTLSNSLIVTGVVSNIEKDYIEIINRKDKMPLERCNMIVKISLFSREAGYLFLMGVTYLSTQYFMRITDLESVSEFEKRAFFRVNTDLTATVQVKGEGSEEGAEENGELEKYIINIRNISLGGLHFSSDRYFDKGEALLIKFFVLGTLLSFQCEICRVKQTVGFEGEFSYGCKFLDGDDRQIDALCKFIFEQQQEEIRKRREALEY